MDGSSSSASIDEGDARDSSEIAASKYQRQVPILGPADKTAGFPRLNAVDRIPTTEIDEDRRGEGARDRDRILYSSAFRRLSGVTQVVSPSGRHPTHNRLTHSLEVAQIAKSIAVRLLHINELGYLSSEGREQFEPFGGLDPDIVEAAALAHDLGHPPFGHVAEATLDRLMVSKARSRDGFEGNAQTFRILTMLSVKNSNLPGLNLTRGTLSAVSKYPWLRYQHSDPKKKGKWGAYAPERESLDWSRQHLHQNLQREQELDRGEFKKVRKDIRTLEAQIMDWADDVAYAIHDLEDFFRVGVIPLDRLCNDDHERQKVLGRYVERRGPLTEGEKEEVEATLNTVLDLSSFTGPFQGTRADRAAVREFTSSMVDRCIRKVRVISDPELGPQLSVPPMEARMVTLLKDILWHYVIDGKALASQRLGQARIIETLFDAFCVIGEEKFVNPEGSGSDKRSRKFEEAMLLFPVFNKEIIDEVIDAHGREKEDEIIARSAADVIAGLTEAQAIDLYHRLTGHILGSALDPIIG